MISRNFKFFFSILFILSISYPVESEDKIDIWKKNKTNEESKEVIVNTPSSEINPAQKIDTDQPIKIQDGLKNNEQQKKVYGIYDPAENDFNLNMWSTTQADDVRSSIKRLKKINLSKTSSEILEKVLLSFSYPPNGMQEKEFVALKINWLIENNRSELIEDFLKQNEEFDGKSSAVQYLVDENIAKADIKEGCQKIKFIDSTIKDSYLEKFKIYCLVYDNKKSQARLLLDLLREQNQSDKFFDDKINYLLGISEKTSSKINEKNLLNFYLSSVTIKDFNYNPTQKTKKEIWKYLNAANLIKLEDYSDKKK